MRLLFCLYLVLLASLPLLLFAKREPNPSTKAKQSKAPKALQQACKGNLALAKSLIDKENST
jgi:hypothetical protein